MLTRQFKGRLGNELFQMASLFGMAIDSENTLAMPKWGYAKYFEHQDVFAEYHGIENFEKNVVSESGFMHSPLHEKFLNKNETIFDVQGYFQSEKYWVNNRDYIKSIFRFKEEFLNAIYKKTPVGVDPSESIGIHVRRGDYVGHSKYHNLPPRYYLQALNKFFTGWRNRQIIVFSDDINYCKQHFGCFQNVYFSEHNSDIEDLALLSLCKDKILSNSTFAWWGAYLSMDGYSDITVRPTQYFEGSYKETHDTRDFWISDWQKYDYTKERTKLHDVSFMIPFKPDSNDRIQNLDLTLAYLRENFETHFILGCNRSDNYNLDPHVGLGDAALYRKTDDKFHRTQMLNQMAEHTVSPILVNWDADVIISPMQIWEAVMLLRTDELQVVYPYNGHFCKVPRIPGYNRIKRTMDVAQFSYVEPKKTDSYGGAVFFDRKAFREGGMENENFISFGPEDQERAHRFMKLGFRVGRVNGRLYHINHYRGPDSSKTHENFKANRAENEKVHAMSAEDLRKYVNSWPWMRK